MVEPASFPALRKALQQHWGALIEVADGLGEICVALDKQEVNIHALGH